MPAHWLPKDRPILQTCLSVKDAAKLRDFIVQVFDVPVHECHTDPSGVLRHAELKFGGAALMLGEACGEFGPLTSSFYVYVPDCDAAFQRAIEAGATSVSPPVTQFYGDRHGSLRDAWGNLWSIATHVEDVSEEEMARRAQEFMAKEQAQS